MSKTIDQRYATARKANPGAILFFVLGDFAEAFYEDAEVIAKALGLTITTRGKGKESMPMTGFPKHQLDRYVSVLEGRGCKVVVIQPGVGP